MLLDDVLEKLHKKYACRMEMKPYCRICIDDIYIYKVKNPNKYKLQDLEISTTIERSVIQQLRQGAKSGDDPFQTFYIPSGGRRENEKWR